MTTEPAEYDSARVKISIKPTQRRIRIACEGRAHSRSALRVAIPLTLLTLVVCAQAAEPKPSIGIYTPRNAVQSAPMRVVVLDAISFKDIETGAVYRLYGIDACAADQTAAMGRQTWPCGTMATAWLVTATLGKWVACNVLEDNGDVNVARCSSAEHADLAVDMLREGQAIAVPDRNGHEIRAYSDAQDSARKAYKGLWTSAFQFPWDYRRDRNTRHDADKPTSQVEPAPPAAQ